MLSTGIRSAPTPPLEQRSREVITVYCHLLEGARIIVGGSGYSRCIAIPRDGSKPFSYAVFRSSLN